MKKLLLALCFVFASCQIVSAAATLTAIWAYNGTPDVIGFKLYHQVPNENNMTLAHDIPGGDIREWTGNIDLVEGKNLFYLTAYTAAAESTHSNAYPLEWVNTSEDLMAPMFRIQWAVEVVNP